jgi:hypothetical protein
MFALLSLTLAVPTPVFDFRGNIVEHTVKETVICLSLLKGTDARLMGYEPIISATGVTLFSGGMSSFEMAKAHTQLLVDDGLALHKTASKPYLETTKDDPRHIGLFYGMFSDLQVNYKDAFDNYMEHQFLVPETKCKIPSGHIVSCETRFKIARQQWYFKLDSKGRESIPPEHAPELSRSDSIINAHAGIATLENIPEEAIDFFTHPVFHGGKNLYERAQNARIVKLFESIGAPFIAGPSGSLLALILTMEGMGASTGEETFTFPNGMVANDDREALICVWAAVLLANGHHSLLELILGAKSVGYLDSIDIPGLDSEAHLENECVLHCYSNTVNQFTELCENILRVP